MQKWRWVLIALLVAASTAVLLADGAFVDEEHTTVSDEDNGELTATGLAAGAAVFWFGLSDDNNTTVSFSTDKTETPEGPLSVVCCTASFELVSWIVPNAEGGDTIGTFDGSEGPPDAWGTMFAAELSGIATSSPIQASTTSATAGNLGGTSWTGPTVACSASCFLVTIVWTNRDFTIGGGSTVCGTCDYTDALTGNTVFAYRREAGAGTYGFEGTLDSDGVVASVIYALSEAGGAPSFVPGIINNPIRGGGLGALLTMTQHPFGARLVRQVMRAR